MARIGIRTCEDTRISYQDMTLEELEESIKESDERSKQLTEWPEM